MSDMSPTEANSTSAMRLDELTALCDEMVALTRVGVPLDRGLLRLAEDLPRRLAGQVKAIGERLQAGESLATVIDTHSDPAWSHVYRSVVQAGLESGRLTSALEGFARVAHRIAELRRVTSASLVYPVVLAVLTGILSVVLIPQFADLLVFSRELQVSSGQPVRAGIQFLTTAAEWFWLLPCTLVAVAAFWWFVTRRAGVSQVHRLSRWVGWVPGAAWLLRNSRLQTFAEVLLLLVRQKVPLAQALPLAGRASGDRGLWSDADAVASQWQQGARPQPQDRALLRDGIPPLMRWSLLQATEARQLEVALQRAAETYGRRAEDAMVWLRIYLPTFMTLGIGGALTAIYAAIILVPWVSLLCEIATEVSGIR